MRSLSYPTLARMGVLLLGGSLLPRLASAQLFSYYDDRPRIVQSVSFSYALVDFQYDGDEEPSSTFDYGDPAYGLTYSRPNLQITALIGDQRRDAAASGLRLLDFTLLTWGELYFSADDNPKPTRFFVPILLHSSYRRVAQKESANLTADAFNVTVLGLGAGVGLNGRYGRHVLLEARATPAVGFAVRAFGNAAGSTYLVDTDVQLHLLSLLGSAGLSLGYDFRYQVWNVSASDIFEEIAGDFHYRGVQQVFRVGVNW